MTNAKWIEYPRAHYFKCSNCKYTVPYRKAFLRNDGKREYNYCPSCGAFMVSDLSCFDCKHHFMSDFYLECTFHGIQNDSNICKDFEEK